MRAPLLTGLLLLCLFLIISCAKPPPWNGLDVSQVMPDLEFNLIDSNGELISEQSFRGNTTLLFFGFTNCPGVCPATLGQISVALNTLGEEGKSVQVLLVSVDPKRDTPQAMKEYTGRFGPWLHGLTGSEADLQKLNHSFKVDFSAQPENSFGDYDVAHSSRVFAFDSNGHCRLLLADSADTPAVVSDLRRLLRE
ncbi:MAG: protein SCO1/2 [Lysobacterales bacterium]|jgi:protein SCO1/2